MAGHGFAPLAEGRDNNFNLLRMLAASTVIVSHSYALPGPPWIEPFLNHGVNLGGCAVIVFFASSGFLIFGSFERRPLLLDFGMARLLRLLPALGLLSLITAFIIGPLFTRLPLSAYFTDRQTYEYVPAVLSLRWALANLPGLFDTLPYKAVNGSLWTLWYEALCYLGLALVGVAGLLARKRFLLALMLYAVVNLALTLTTHVPTWLAQSFVLGMIVYRYRERVPAHFAIVVALALLAAAATWRDVLGVEARVLAISYGALWAAQINIPALLQYNRIGDYSYGVYIYGWPIQQMVITLNPNIHPLLLIAAALPAATLCGAISWFTIERPALRQKRAASQLATRIFSRLGAVAGRHRPLGLATHPVPVED